MCPAQAECFAHAQAQQTLISRFYSPLPPTVLIKTPRPRAVKGPVQSHASLSAVEPGFKSKCDPGAVSL